MQKHPTARSSGACASKSASSCVRERMPPMYELRKDSRKASAGSDEACVSKSSKPAAVKTSLALGRLISNRKILPMPHGGRKRDETSTSVSVTLGLGRG